MAWSNASDWDLLAATLEEDAGAYAELLRRWKSLFCRDALTKRKPDVEDHIAEVVKRMFPHVWELEPDKCRAYARTVSRRLAEERTKKQKREEETLKRVAELVPPTADPPRVVPLRVLRLLTPAEMAVFEARHRDGLAWSKIAVRLGRPVPTLTSVDQRLKKKIRAAMLAPRRRP